MKNCLMMTEAQQDYIKKKIFALVERFPKLKIAKVSVEGDGNVFELSFVGSIDSRSLQAISESYSFSEAVTLLRQRVLRQIYDAQGKIKTMRKIKPQNIDTEINNVR